MAGIHVTARESSRTTGTGRPPLRRLTIRPPRVTIRTSNAPFDLLLSTNSSLLFGEVDITSPATPCAMAA
jgi:hypothetical protein